jgi:hypothetical protein
MLGPTERVARCRGLLGVVGVVGLARTFKPMKEGGDMVDAGGKLAELGGEAGGSVGDDAVVGDGSTRLFELERGRWGALTALDFKSITEEAGERERWLEASSEFGGMSSSLNGTGTSCSGLM